MSITINENRSTLDAQGSMNRTQSQLSGAFERISSGLRTNKAGDDAAGLGMSEQLQATQRQVASSGRPSNDTGALIAAGKAGSGSKGLSAALLARSADETQGVDAVGPRPVVPPGLASPERAGDRASLSPTAKFFSSLSPDVQQAAYTTSEQLGRLRSEPPSADRDARMKQTSERFRELLSAAKPLPDESK